MAGGFNFVEHNEDRYQPHEGRGITDTVVEIHSPDLELRTCRGLSCGQGLCQPPCRGETIV
eukprot:14369643-Alexandrium_andersonii.AAC.1